jgi:hypothetical protein
MAADAAADKRTRLLQQLREGKAPLLSLYTHLTLPTIA